MAPARAPAAVAGDAGCGRVSHDGGVGIGLQQRERFYRVVPARIRRDAGTVLWCPVCGIRWMICCGFVGSIFLTCTIPARLSRLVRHRNRHGTRPYWRFSIDPRHRLIQLASEAEQYIITPETCHVVQAD